MSSPDFLNGCARALAKHLDAKIPSLKEVFDEWPSHNQRLRLPAMSVITQGTPSLTWGNNSYIHRKGTVDSHAALVQYVVGQYDLTLQLDFWCRNKEERGDIHQKFIDLATEEVNNQGFTLPMSDYYGILCNYIPVGYTFGDSEEQSQRQEWRLRVDILATANAIREKREFIMTSIPEVTVYPIEDTTETL